MEYLEFPKHLCISAAGTPSQISGPTAPMTVTIAVVVAKYAAAGQQSLVFSVVFLAGLFQIVLGWLRLGSYIQLVPRPVISGFMTGIHLVPQPMSG